MSDPADDRLHPRDGPDPAQPPLPLGAAPGALAETTEGTPPFVMRCLSIAEWRPFIAGYAFTWRLPKTVVLHHTYRPDQHTWRGLTSMRGMQRYYAGLGWTSAPHIYCASDGIWLATPLERIGIHAGANNGSVRAGWYSIGLEVVWNGNVSRPYGATWDNTLAVLAGLSARLGRPLAEVLAFHRDSSIKSCPGARVTRAWVLAEFAALTPPVLPPAPRGTPILGPASGTQAAAIAWLTARATQYNALDIRTIVSAYARIGDAAGVDWFLALAQCAHETGSLTSWWCARPRRNPAGIGVTGDARQGPQPGLNWVRDADDHAWLEGISFARWDADAIRAHLGRMLGYALAPGAGTAEQRALVEYALTVRPLSSTVQGRHPTMDTFGGTWAVDKGYGPRVIGMRDRMQGAS